MFNRRIPKSKQFHQNKLRVLMGSDYLYERLLVYEYGTINITHKELNDLYDRIASFQVENLMQEIAELDKFCFEKTVFDWERSGLWR